MFEAYVITLENILAMVLKILNIHQSADGRIPGFRHVRFDPAVDMGI